MKQVIVSLCIASVCAGAIVPAAWSHEEKKALGEVGSSVCPNIRVSEVISRPKKQEKILLIHKDFQCLALRTLKKHLRQDLLEKPH